MNAPLDVSLLQTHRLAESVAEACSRIAPTWPLDRMIAVNPCWGWVGQPIDEASSRLAVLAGSELVPSRERLRELWQAGRFGPAQLKAVAARHAPGPGAAELQAALEHQGPAAPRLPLVPQALDQATPGAVERWADRVVHQVSQHAAAHFDGGLQSRWVPPAPASFFAGWKQRLAADRGIPWPQGRTAAVRQVQALPDEPWAALSALWPALGLPDRAQAPFLTALLLDLNGWAAWCAHERWQARLAGGDDESLVHLLAVRLAWEVLLHAALPPAARAAWAQAWADADGPVRVHAEARRIDWLLLEALELAYQAPLGAGLATPGHAPAERPWLQAVFCIDVRSEVLRRALEGVDPGVRTRGFAGFFGLPIAYQTLGSEELRPQLPGLLAPALTAVEEPADGAALGQVLARRRQRAARWGQGLAQMRGQAGSAFGFVESCGLVYGARLVADSLAAEPCAESPGTRPRLPLADTDTPAAARLARGVLQAMGLPDRLEGLAPLVLLAGHGGRSANNPQAAALDCGACGGQTGEVNARVLAGLLNDARVRAALAADGLALPADTVFVPALHDTSTDEIRLFDTDSLALAPGCLPRLQHVLDEAGRRTRAERAPALGLDPARPPRGGLLAALRQRSVDWAQVRPEWALAGCAAFVVAPRRRSRGLNLAGRAFLHDYDHRQDPGHAVLELIMTAPMVVTHWINFQYHASTLDNRRWGSGNKVLHNVVGGRLGVFEGHGGDLRIGLPMQSLHDGRRWRHEPLRLSVFIEAPRQAIDGILLKHDTVRHLVDHGWLHLLRLDPEQAGVEQRRGGRWQALEGAGGP